jgi:citrate lyase subunit gamma (acyl carrier protein)
MEINKISKAGTVESNDIYIVMMPNPKGGIELDLESIVMKQFGDVIREIILDTLQSLEVKSAIIKAQDKGALDYTIKARVETAVKRAQ